MLTRSLSLLAAAATLILVSGVELDIPLDGQLPTIARVDQPYSWSFSPKTFSTTNGSLTYDASSMPSWLSFDPTTLTLHGTPTLKDEGNPKISITAKDSNSSESSDLTLCVTHYPPPTVNHPFNDQFYPNNPSFSSVFLLSNNSAIVSSNPALRVPGGWSFSIGFDYDTYKSSSYLYYDALQADGSPLPDWITFKPKAVTFNGVSPNQTGTQIISLSLHASDQEGYTASTATFDLVVASKELILTTAALPTINVTASTPFSVSLTSPADFTGVMAGNDTIQPSDISTLLVDTSAYGRWLSYDPKQRILSGTPPDSLRDSGQSPVLPVTLATTFNQTIKTNVSIALVPSFFSVSSLPPAVADKDGRIQVDLAQYFSNSTSLQKSDVTLSVSFNATGAEQFLNFDPSSAQLTGSLPSNFSSHIAATFTAYSHVTHSTSHTGLSMYFPNSKESRGPSLSSASGEIASKKHHALVIALAVSLSLLGAIILFVFLSIMRRYLREKDTALTGEEGASAWTEKEKRYYGINDLPISPRNTTETGWSKSPTPRPKFYGDIGRGLRGVSPSALAAKVGSPGSVFTSPGVMRRGEFLGKIKQKVREVSDRYTRTRTRRPVIGKPTLTSSSTSRVNIDGLPFSSDASLITGSPVNPFDDANSARSYAGSGDTSLASSPTGSTDGRSIPRRRADFAPPRVPATVHFGKGKNARGRADSLDSVNSAETHAAEAVVMTATRTPSIQSAKSQSAISSRFVPERLKVGGPRPHPKIVPFAPGVPVPTPRSPSAPVFKGKGRVVSHVAEAVKGDTGNDELAMGAFFVSELGADKRTSRSTTGDASRSRTQQSTLTISTNVRSSFSSLESSHQDHGQNDDRPYKFVTRVGQRFKFRIATTAQPQQFLQGRLVGGAPIPAFLQNDLKSAKRQKNFVEFEGRPTQRDMGIFEVEIFAVKSGHCVAKFAVEVVGEGR